MYQISRSIYREIEADIIEDLRWGDGPNNHERVLRACEAAVKRLTTDRHYFARPSRTLFNDIRTYFPMSAQLHVYRVVDRYMTFASDYLATPADRGDGAHRREARLPRHDAQGHAVPAHAAAAQRLLPVAPAPGRDRGGARRRVTLPPVLLGRRRRRDLHRRRRRGRRPAGDREGADHAARPVRGRAGGGRRRAGARRSATPPTSPRSRTARRWRPTRCWRATARAPCSSRPRASRTSSSWAGRRAPTSTGCAPRIPPPLVPPERRVGAPERMTPDGPLRALDGPRRARGGRSPATTPRRSRSACCTPTATRSTSRRSATRCARGSPTSTSRSRTRSSARSASTSAPPRPRSTPPSPPCSRAYLAALADRARERGAARSRT